MLALWMCTVSVTSSTRSQWANLWTRSPVMSSRLISPTLSVRSPATPRAISQYLSGGNFRECSPLHPLLHGQQDSSTLSEGPTGHTNVLPQPESSLSAQAEAVQLCEGGSQAGRPEGERETDRGPADVQAEQETVQGQERVGG